MYYDRSRHQYKHYKERAVIFGAFKNTGWKPPWCHTLYQKEKMRKMLNFLCGRWWVCGPTKCKRCRCITVGFYNNGHYIREVKNSRVDSARRCYGIDGINTANGRSSSINKYATTFAISSHSNSKKYSEYRFGRWLNTNSIRFCMNEHYNRRWRNRTNSIVMLLNFQNSYTTDPL